VVAFVPPRAPIGVESELASPSIPSWNQILAWLREMAELRESGVAAA
jgi:hypothetical protein